MEEKIEALKAEIDTFWLNKDVSKETTLTFEEMNDNLKALLKIKEGSDAMFSGLKKPVITQVKKEPSDLQKQNSDASLNLKDMKIIELLKNNSLKMAVDPNAVKMPNVPWEPGEIVLDAGALYEASIFGNRLLRIQGIPFYPTLVPTTEIDWGSNLETDNYTLVTPTFEAKNIQTQTDSIQANISLFSEVFWGDAIKNNIIQQFGFSYAKLVDTYVINSLSAQSTVFTPLVTPSTTGGRLASDIIRQILSIMYPPYADKAIIVMGASLWAEMLTDRDSEGRYILSNEQGTPLKILHGLEVKTTRLLINDVYIVNPSLFAFSEYIKNSGQIQLQDGAGHLRSETAIGFWSTYGGYLTQPAASFKYTVT